MSINNGSLCRNPEELKRQIAWIEKELEPGRKVAGTLSGPHDLGDIVVQEYIEGQDYSCTVLELNDTIVAFSPTRYCYPRESPAKNRFLHWDLKFHPELHVELFHRHEDPGLYDKIQALAVKSFKANRMAGGAWGNVDFRVRYDDGEPVVIEVNPMPAVFLPPGEHEWEDLVIRECLPGGHRALISILVATKHFQTHTQVARTAKVVGRYDEFAKDYDDLVGARSELPSVTSKLVSKFNFEGSVLDLGSGTGSFGKLVKDFRQAQHPLVGVEPSEGMRRKCQQTFPGLYDRIHPELMQEVIMSLPSFDHVVAMDSMHFLDLDTFVLMMCRAFQLAKQSVTVSLAEFTDEYNTALLKRAEPWMHSVNNVPELDAFGVPKGWKLVYRERHFAWVSPHTQEKIFATFFRFERLSEPLSEQTTAVFKDSSKRHGFYSMLSSLWR